jgi:hypothetical protein
LKARYGVRFRAPKTLRAVVLTVALFGTLLQAGTAAAAPPDPSQMANGDVEKAKPAGEPKAKPEYDAGKPKPEAGKPKPEPGKPKVDFTRPAKPAVTADATCSGPLAWPEIVSCSAIAEGDSDVYTVTTSVPQEPVLFRFTADWSFAEIEAEGAESSCRFNVGLMRCVFTTAGTHAVTVQASYGSGNYWLAAASLVSSGCPTLTAADLSPAAPGRDSVLQSQAVGDCFGFAAADGDRLRFGPSVDDAKVYDAAGAEVCAVSWMNGTKICTMSGPSPYRTVITQARGTELGYTLHLAKLNAPVGCAALPPAPFGDPGTALATGRVALGQTACRAVAAAAGPHAVNYEPGPTTRDFVNAEVFDPSGDPVCSDLESCQFPVAGNYTVLLENAYQDEPVDFHVSVVALGDTRGCATPVGTSWDLPVVTTPVATRVDLACQPIEAQVGERVLARSLEPDGGKAAKVRVVDATGAKACDPDYRDGGCVLEGSAPFRVLSRLYPNTGMNEYHLDIGRLSNAVGCTPTAVTNFGTLPPAAADGSRCRELTVSTAATYRIDDRVASGDEGNGGAYGTDGLQRCTNLLYCQLEPGKYTLLAAASARIAVFPLTSTAGCLTQATDTFAGYAGTLAGPSQYDCVLLSAPAGAEVVPVEPAGQTRTEGQIVDATGNNVCNWESWIEFPVCDLQGTAPFRALIHASPYGTTGAYRIAVPRNDISTGCPTLPQSDFTNTGGTAFTLRPERFTTCFVVPANAHSAMETFQYARTGAAGAARVLVRTPDVPEERCWGESGTAYFTICPLRSGKAYTVLMVGGDANGAYRLARRDITSTARGCTPVTATGVGAIAGSSQLADASDVRCYTVPAAATDQFVVNTRDAANSIGATVLQPSGEYVCKTFGEMRCVARGATGYQVLVWNDPSFGAVGPFRLETTRISTAAGPAADCVKAPSAGYGFGPLTGEVTTAKPASCVTFQLGNSEQFQGYANNQVDGGPAPLMISRTPSGAEECYTDDGVSRFSCYGDAAPQMLLLNLPESEAGPLKWTVSGSCETPLCAGAAFGVQTVTPASAVTGTTATLTLKGQSLHLKDVVHLTAAGQPTIAGTVKSVSADRTSATVAFALGTAPAGARDVVVTSFSGPAVTLAKAFTITPKPLVVVKAPFLVAPVRVGSVVKADPGTWSPAATSAKYQWRNDGVVIAGATANSYTPPAAMLLHKLSVTVTVSRAGSASTTLTSAAVTVARGAAPVVTKAPAITGTVQANHTVGVSVGTWSPACTTYAYQWYSGGAAVSGATKSTLLLTSAMAKKALWVAVACGRTGHDSGRALSASVTVSA